MRQTLTGWKSKLLTYAGRLELIRSTLSSFHIFWSANFLLPKSYNYTLEALVRNFFWGSFEVSCKMKTIAWSNICRPFMQGGLGISIVESIADAAVQRQTWSIASNRDSIWVRWAYNKYIKGKSFWNLKVPSNCSWG